MIKKRRMTKKVLQAEQLRRELEYKGMIESEIKDLLPLNKVILYENKNSGALAMYVPQCTICGYTHIHGVGDATSDVELSHRLAHCELLDSKEVVPSGYILLIDQSNSNNIRLATKYGITLADASYQERKYVIEDELQMFLK